MASCDRPFMSATLSRNFSEDQIKHSIKNDISHNRLQYTLVNNINNIYFC